MEFSADPKILLNYKETELHNPTIVRNSFTKQLQIPGTARNNDVFGHIWELTRVQDSNFNPIRKTDFELYVNDELFQRGYVKLDKVTRTNNTISYNLTLYGGLGSFFFNLMYDQDDYGNTKKTLADLWYGNEYEYEPQLDFTIDKDAVYEAWGQIAGFGSSTNPRWRLINFIPCLNGIPADFDARKVLINNYQLGQGAGFSSSITDGGKTYTAVLNSVANTSGYTLGEANEDLQEWQTRDLRSYNQRPCINMQRIIDACCQPENNGGYQVKLDEHFFHSNNPYYTEAWVTLPMLRDLDGVGKGESYAITGATISTETTVQYGPAMYPVNFNSPAIGSLNNVNMNVSLRFTPAGSTSAQVLYPHHTFHASRINAGLQANTYVKDAEMNQGLIMQLFAIGQGGEVVGQSKAYLLGGQKNWHQKDKSPMWENWWYKGGPDDYGTEPSYEYVEGQFYKNGSTYVFCNNNGQETDINFTFQAPNDFASIMVKMKAPQGNYTKYAVAGSGQGRHENVAAYSQVALYSSKNYEGTGKYTASEAYAEDRVNGVFSFVVTSMDAIGNDYEQLFSGTRITKDRLLSTENSPADYLLSYCKMFGLYFYYDSTEDADDPVKYPSGVVHIMDRDTFYTDEVVDLSKMIDWNKNVEITPAMADAKWYKFDVEHTEGELEQKYKEQYGRDYGCQYVNTNYNFDNNTIDLYDGNVFKSGVMALEKDKYYKKTSLGLPVYQYNGFKYTLFARESPTSEFTGYDVDFPASTTLNMTNINPDYEYYDAFPKLQLHEVDNAPVDGSNILLFFKSPADMAANYWITDDVMDMITLNGGTACWIMTNAETNAAGQTIARRVNVLPVFTRDLILYGQNYGNIVHSWNFGHPQVIYSPDTYTTDGDAIYDVAWKDYIGDLYSVDTRKLVCSVRAEMDERPWPYWLRRFYWFENSIWRLNEIKDLDIGSFDTTKMEFIKVQDMDNYKLDRIEYQGSNSVVLDQKTVPCSGGTITGHVYMQSGGGWFAGEVITGQDTTGGTHYIYSEGAMTPTSGRGETSTSFSLTVPQNTGTTAIEWTIRIEDDFDNVYSAVFSQDSCNQGLSALSISPTAITVGSATTSYTFAVTIVNITGVRAAVDVDWGRLSWSGDNLIFNFATNTGSTRDAHITVSGTGSDNVSRTATATLTQSGSGGGGGGNISLDKYTLDLDWGTGGYHADINTFQVQTNGNWTSTITDR